MSPHLRSVAIAAAAALTLVDAAALELEPVTLAAFDRYVRLTEARMAAEVAGTEPFLWVDRQPPQDREVLLARLKRGDVITQRLRTRDGTKNIEVEHGLIHHWVGTILLPAVQLDRAIAVVQAYERYPEWFGPTILRAHVLRHAGDHFDVAMRTSMKKVITVVIDADYRIDYRRLSASRLYTRSEATNLFEVKSAGQPDEVRLPGDQTSGFLWRLNNYCWFEERSEGTYEQCESISLTRGIPFGLGLIVRPFVTGIPRETLEFTLGRVRDALRN
jgi:hypothetical protein